ncbi:death domain-containing protein 1-like [Mya arenaria]|uniref:death domain-containing protein 1-like n=1 Tax=Mya arenaria TaxID=6604 RepID=UPI0022E3C608|nr:death domain-containing protein 1-like [Mya arenaria]
MPSKGLNSQESSSRRSSVKSKGPIPAVSNAGTYKRKTNQRGLQNTDSGKTLRQATFDEHEQTKATIEQTTEKVTEEVVENKVEDVGEEDNTEELADNSASSGLNGAEAEVEQKKPETPPPSPTPEGFSLEKFNKSVDEYADVFSLNKYLSVTDDYPVEALKTLTNDVTVTVDEFRQNTLDTERHLEALRERMHYVKQCIQEHVQKKTNAIRMDDESSTIEDKEIKEKFARMNLQVARANAELADALRLITETEHVVTETHLSVEKAKEEARNIQEELEFKAKVEARRREQERKRQEEERRKMEEAKLQEELERLEKEEEWKRREHGDNMPPAWNTWPEYEYQVDGELGCIVRSSPGELSQNDIRVTSLDQIDHPVPFSEQEELVSAILDIQGRGEEARLPDKLIVCVPYHAGKQTPHGHSSREPVVKVENDGHWVCLETREETFENHKDQKFAVAEVKGPCRVAVFSRLKRDYSTISKRGGKMMSSYDQRISLTIPKDCLDGKDHIMMEVQPVDSSSVNDLKTKSPNCKGLLSSSPIIHMDMESTTFEKPVTVTVPCPPNPTKAKKIAAMRKAKEEKMKNPPKIQILLPHEIEAIEKEKQKSKLQKMQEQLKAEENEKEEPKPTKWYMGDYAVNEDDENDNLFLISSHGNKWAPVENVNIMQVKLDLLQFDLDRPLDKFMVLRTKTNVLEDTVGNMANEVSNFLSQKLVQVILKQRSDDPFDTVMSVVPSTKTEKTLKKLSEEGYDDGPEPSQVLSINEGDVIEVGFRGNIKSKGEEGIQFVYNSNLESETEFHACEVDKYLQRNFPVYRGVVEVYRNYKVKNQTKRKRHDSTDDQDESPYEHKRELMCELAINIPKYHVEQNSTVHRAPVTIRNTTDPVNDDLVRFLAEELGDEWKTVGNYLSVSKPRIQAILRNLAYGDCSEVDAKYDMLMTWLKKTPKAVDKVSCLSNALLKSGRGDLAEEIKSRDREFKEHLRAH